MRYPLARGFASERRKAPISQNVEEKEKRSDVFRMSIAKKIARESTRGTSVPPGGNREVIEWRDVEP